MFLICSISASSLGTFQKGECIELYQFCDDCTYVNLTSITFPNSSLAYFNTQMTKTNSNFNYTFCDTSTRGDYSYTVCGDKGGSNTCENIEFSITEGGDNFDLPQAIMVLAQFGLVALFFGIGLTFKKEKWKLRTFFFIIALLMGVIFLNSIRIIIGTSTNLSKMGNVSLILGIVVLLFMFLYLFINALIEVFYYFKNKQNMKWEIGHI